MYLYFWYMEVTGWFPGHTLERIQNYHFHKGKCSSCKVFISATWCMFWTVIIPILSTNKNIEHCEVVCTTFAFRIPSWWITSAYFAWMCKKLQISSFWTCKKANYATCILFNPVKPYTGRGLGTCRYWWATRWPPGRCWGPPSAGATPAAFFDTEGDMRVGHSPAYSQQGGGHPII